MALFVFFFFSEKTHLKVLFIDLSEKNNVYSWK